MDKQSLKDLKDATPEDQKVAEDLEKAEREAGIPHPEENRKEGGKEK
jgi:hypothetical protein